jgi:hypothetical protein
MALDTDKIDEAVLALLSNPSRPLAGLEGV